MPVKNSASGFSFATMSFVLWFIFLLLVLYAVVIFYYAKSWRQIPLYRAPLSAVTPGVSFSIIIPARNEAENIGKLLDSLMHQTYPKHLFEVIVVDDHSSDNTAEIVSQYEEVILLQLKEDKINSYKKKAIETGIVSAQRQWIVGTDADCVAHPEWLQTFASYIEKANPVFIAAPVSLVRPRQSFHKQSAFLQINDEILYVFQALDFLTLQGITGAAVYTQKHNMCNGANLAYKKDVFYEVGGFKDIDTIASGDDMLLMHKIWKQHPSRIGYLKSEHAIIQTEAAATWKDFFNQRIRWASKATSYDDKRIFGVLLLVYLFNVSFLGLLLISVFFNSNYFLVLIACWVLKTAVERFLVKQVGVFFNQQKLMRYFFFFQPLHIVYTIVAGFLGSFGKYEWKGRRVK